MPANDGEAHCSARPMSSRHPNDRDESQEVVFRFLADPKTLGRSEPVERVDTAGAVVFLAGADAYKVKRAVKFPFMDLSTLDKRREACDAEIAVNRPSAPQIYLSALPITQQGGTFALGGDGEIVEWVTHMRRFDENATLDRIADHEGVLDAIIDKLALAVRRSHARAPLRDGARAAHALDTYIEQNNAAFAERPDLFDPPAARKLTVDSRLSFAVLRPVLLKRGWFRSSLSRRSAPAQHRSHRRRADAVRRGGIFGRHSERGRSLRSGFSFDGSGGARFARRSQPALQPLSRPRASGCFDRPRRAAAVLEFARRDFEPSRGGQR